jgi:hypothetical protein
MKNLIAKFKFKKSLLIGMSFHAIVITSVVVLAEPTNLTLIKTITKLHLPIQTLKSPKQYEKEKTGLSRQEKILLGFAMGSSPSQAGIPQPEDQVVSGDDITAAYSTSSLLDEAIDKAQTLPVGERISHFETMALEIVQLSEKQNRPDEELIRITLNRAVDVIQGILPVMGTNNELIAQLVANIYQEHFNLAKMFANSPRQLSYRGKFSASNPYSGFSIAEFGRIYSTLLWRFSASLTSKASKAIMMMKLVGYLGYDVNLDQNRENQSLQEVLADVIRLQSQNANYQKILNDLESDIEPSTVNQLRSDVTFILHKLPARLQQAGIRSLGSTYNDGP